MNPADDYTLREQDEALIVQIGVENLLGVSEVNRVGEKLNALVKDQPRKLILDVTKVRYAGSAALGMLISLSRDLQERGGKLVLTGTHHLDAVLKVSRTLAVFEIAPTVDEALQHFRK